LSAVLSEAEIRFVAIFTFTLVEKL